MLILENVNSNKSSLKSLRDFRNLKDFKRENSYYRIPQIFFDKEKYKLTIGAKLLYAVLRDRINLSMKNKWTDEKGNVYCVFSDENLSKLLQVTKRTIQNWKYELVNNNLLFIEKQRDFTLAPRLFLLRVTKDKNNKMFRLDSLDESFKYYRIAKKLFVDNAFKVLNFKEKVFFQVVENKFLQNKKHSGTVFFTNSDLVNDLGISKPTIIKYKNKIVDLGLLNKQDNKLVVKKVYLKSIKSTYTDSINDFYDKVNSLGVKNKKKTKFFSLLNRVIENKLKNLNSKDKFRFIEKIINLKGKDIVELVKKLCKIDFSSVTNIVEYISKILLNTAKNRLILSDIDVANQLFEKREIEEENLLIQIEKLREEKLTEEEKNKIKDFISTKKQYKVAFDERLFLIATKYAHIFNKKSISYIIGIVRNWSLDNIKKFTDLTKDNFTLEYHKYYPSRLTIFKDWLKFNYQISI